MAREPLSLRWHKASYPRHLVWRKQEIVLATFRINRMFERIDWED